jgi:hypothetical protein
MVALLLNDRYSRVWKSHSEHNVNIQSYHHIGLVAHVGLALLIHNIYKLYASGVVTVVTDSVLLGLI